MSSISKFLEADHARCDALFASAQAGAEKQDWERVEADFHAFAEALSRHMAMEEKTLFPAMESISGNSAGPTAVMRMEHRQFRELIESCHAALAAHNAPDFLAVADTLKILMVRHNLKEESILYPMADQLLGDRAGEVTEAMQATESAATGA